MQQFDFNKPFVDYDDKPYKKMLAQGVETSEEIMMGKTFSENLKAMTKGDIIKLDDWARVLHKGDPLILDNADRKELERMIRDEFTGMSIHIKRQLLDVLANGHEIKSDTNGTTGGNKK